MLEATFHAMLLPSRELNRILDEIAVDEQQATATVERLLKQARQTDYMSVSSIEALAVALEEAAAAPLTLEHRVRLERLAGDVREDALVAEGEISDLMGG